MVDLTEMQAAYAQQVEQLRSDLGYSDWDFEDSEDLNSHPTVGQGEQAVAYANELQALYGQAYTDRINAVFADYTQSNGSAPDAQTQLTLTDQVRQSFGENSNAAAPIVTSGPLDFNANDQASVGISGSVLGDIGGGFSALSDGAAAAASAAASSAAGVIKAAFTAAPLTMAIVAVVLLGVGYFFVKEEL